MTQGIIVSWPTPCSFWVENSELFVTLDQKILLFSSLEFGFQLAILLSVILYSFAQSN